MRNVLMIFICWLLTSCAYVSPDAGQEAVLTDKPYLFGSGGVEQQSIKTGRSFTWFSTQIAYVSVLPEQKTVHFDDLMTSDGVPLDFDAVARVRVKDTVRLISQFGEKWWENNLEAEVRNRVRQSVRKHGMNETAIQSDAINAIDDEVTKALIEYIGTSMLPVELIGFTVGRANPPDSIKHQRVETATQEQRQQTEKQRKLAEDQREAAERSRANADNAYRQAIGLSADQFVSLEQIKMLRETCATKDSCTFIVGDGVPVVGSRR